MKKALILLADGFELTEATTVYDVLKRTHQIDVTGCSISSSHEVEASNFFKVFAEAIINEVKASDYDFLVLPGGKRGVAGLSASESALALIASFHDSGKPIYAICAAPSILGNLGYLDGKNYTCFPGFQVGKGNYLDQGVVIDGALITGHSMAYSLPFAQAIVKAELGEESVNAIHHGLYGTPNPIK